ncbi:hypothetical protein BJ508DRAFT_29806 [Ascobolus immersus RN42]|uniref:Uncharacterized protein n=1 Tax=Ascobolus immersus RN42 TaxID=1160509 RepID=A0A3N4HLS4_ASCIM|nr:hypothetical protein BJ508DRAFT_29806 [Ascobolus immersus RN42]
MSDDIQFPNYIHRNWVKCLLSTLGRLCIVFNLWPYVKVLIAYFSYPENDSRKNPETGQSARKSEQ